MQLCVIPSPVEPIHFQVHHTNVFFGADLKNLTVVSSVAFQLLAGSFVQYLLAHYELSYEMID